MRRNRAVLRTSPDRINTQVSPRSKTNKTGRPILILFNCLKRRISSYQESLFHVSFLECLKSQKIIPLPPKFSDNISKITSMVDAFKKMYMKAISEIFCALSDETSIITERREVSERNEQDIMIKYCVWRIIFLSRTCTEQMSLWKWKFFIRKIENEMKGILKHLSIKKTRVSHLLKNIVLHGSIRYFSMKKHVLGKWAKKVHQSKTQSLRIIKKFSFSKNFAITISHLLHKKIGKSFKDILSFQPPIKSSSISKDKYLRFKPYISNICKIFKKKTKYFFRKWKRQTRPPAKSLQIIEIMTLTYKSLSKPTISISVLEKNSKVSGVSNNNNISRGDNLQIFGTTQKGLDKFSSKDNGVSSADTTIADYLCTSEKLEKLKICIIEFLRVYEAKNNMPRSIISRWMQITNKKLLVVSKLKHFISSQKLKKQSLKHSFTELSLISKYQTEFTDIE